MLRRLAGGMMGGLALATDDQPAQAKTMINPADTNNQIGTIVVPPGKPLPSDTPLTFVGTYYYGLVATDGTNVNLNIIYSYGNAGLSGLASGTNSTGVYGSVSSDYGNGVYGEVGVKTALEWSARLLALAAVECTARLPAFTAMEYTARLITVVV